VHSTSTDVLAGTWGDHTAAEILSVTAAEAGTSQSGLGDGDTITVVFDKQTTIPTVATKSDVDDLFTFSAQIGDDYTAAWTSYTTVQITIVDATHAAAQELTRVGVLRLTVKAAYALQSADESSPVSTSTGVLEGSWLAHSAPVIVSCNASDGGSQEGIGNGDVITVVFDQETNSPAIATKADVDAVFAFTDPTSAVVSLGADYTAAYAWEAVTGTLSVTSGSAVVSCSEDMRSTLDRGDEVQIGGVVYRVSLSGAYSASQLTLDSTYSGSTAGSEAVSRRSRNTMLITIVDVCDQVSVGVGLDVLTGAGGSCNDTAPYKNTRVNSGQWGNGMSLTVKASGDLTSEDRSSALSTATLTLSGTWGAHAAPAIMSTTASDAGSAAGLNTGDKITVVFDRHTNVPAVSAKANVDTLLAFGATLGTDYTGVWLSLSVMEITVTELYIRTADDMVSPFITADDLVPNVGAYFNNNDINATAPYQDTKVGTLTVTVNAGSYLQSADLSSVHSTSTDVLAGTWGDHTAPSITSVEAQEYGMVGVGVDAGDIMIITFDQPTNTPIVSSKAGVDAVFMFSSSIGTDYSGTWTSLSTVIVTIIVGECDSEPCNYDGTDAGKLVLSTKASADLKSADESSPSSSSRRTVGGSWGDVPIAPTNMSVQSIAHDGILLSFNAPVRNNGANITHYQVSYTVHGKQEPVRTIDAAALFADGAGAILGSRQHYFLGNLQPGTAYSSISVRAMNYFGAGAASSVVTATTAHAGAFYFSRAGSRVDNNNGNTVIITVTVSRHGGADVATMVEYESSLGVNGKLRYQTGVTEQEFSFSVDTQENSYSDLPSEAIMLTLRNPTHGGSLGYPSMSYVVLAKDSAANNRDTMAIISGGKSTFDFRTRDGTFEVEEKRK